MFKLRYIKTYEVLFLGFDHYLSRIVLHGYPHMQKNPSFARICTQPVAMLAALLIKQLDEVKSIILIFRP